MSKEIRSACFKDKTGEEFVTNEGCNLKIIEYRGAFNCDIQFEDGLVLKNLQYDNIKNGAVKNPYHTSDNYVMEVSNQEQ